MDINKIEKFLERNRNNCISFNYKGLKLDNGEPRNKFCWTRDQILQVAPDVETFLKSLPSKGFYDGTELFFRQIMGGTTFKPKGMIILKFKNGAEPQKFNPTQQNDSTMSNGQTVTPPTLPATQNPPITTPAPIGLGYAQVQQHDLIDLMVKKGRYEDLADKCKKAESDLQATKNELELLKVKNANLELQIKTSEKLNELTLRENELKKKPWHESEAVKQGIEALGAVLPQLLGGNNQPQGALAGALTQSPIKNEFITAMGSEQITDEHAAYLKLTLKGIATIEGFKESLEQLLNHANLVEHGE